MAILRIETIDGSGCGKFKMCALMMRILVRIIRGTAKIDVCKQICAALVKSARKIAPQFNRLDQINKMVVQVKA